MFTQKFLSQNFLHENIANYDINPNKQPPSVESSGSGNVLFTEMKIHRITH